MKKILLLLLSLILLAAQLQAAEFRRIGQDYRALAMGNTGIVTASNSNALYYNPAAMALITDYWFDFPSMESSYNGDGLPLSSSMIPSELGDILKSVSGYTVPDGWALHSADQTSFYNNYKNTSPYIKYALGLNAMFNIQTRGTTIGFNRSVEYTHDMTIYTSDMDYYGKKDLIHQGGFSLPIGMGQLVLGGAWRYVERTEYTELAAANTGDLPHVMTDGTTGSGIGYDIGFLWRTASKMRIVWGGVYRAPIVLSGGLDPIPAELALGMGIVHNWDNLNMTIAVDYRDLTNQLGSVGSRKLHIGTEFGFFPFSDNQAFYTLRYGYNQGLWSQGVEVSMGKGLILGLTRYQESNGVDASPQGRLAYYFNIGF